MKKWCKDIFLAYKKIYALRQALNGILQVPEEWKFCPICGKKRPAKQSPQGAQSKPGRKA